MSDATTTRGRLVRLAHRVQPGAAAKPAVSEKSSETTTTKTDSNAPDSGSATTTEKSTTKRRSNQRRFAWFAGAVMGPKVHRGALLFAGGTARFPLRTVRRAEQVTRSYAPSPITWQNGACLRRHGSAGTEQLTAEAGEAAVVTSAPLVSDGFREVLAKARLIKSTGPNRSPVGIGFHRNSGASLFYFICILRGFR